MNRQLTVFIIMAIFVTALGCVDEIPVDNTTNVSTINTTHPIQPTDTPDQIEQVAPIVNSTNMTVVKKTVSLEDARNTKFKGVGGSSGGGGGKHRDNDDDDAEVTNVTSTTNTTVNTTVTPEPTHAPIPEPIPEPTPIPKYVDMIWTGDSIISYSQISTDPMDTVSGIFSSVYSVSCENDGVWGDGYPYIYDRFKQNITGRHPKFVVIEGGVNNVQAENNLNDTQIFWYIEAQVNECNANGIKPVVLLLLPTDGYLTNAQNKRLDVINQKIIDRHNAVNDFVLVDAREALGNYDNEKGWVLEKQYEHENDGVHLSVSGNRLLAGMIYYNMFPPVYIYKNSTPGYTQEGIQYYEVGADGNKIILTNNESATDPTFDQLVSFIRSDKTDMIPYNDTTFVCADYAEMVHNNAERVGIKAGWVGIEFTDIYFGHAINVFDTVDRGIIYVDCTNAYCNSTDGVCPSNWDDTVVLTVGSEYTLSGLYTDESFDPHGTVEWFYTYW